jgi:TPR repeat protein
MLMKKTWTWKEAFEDALESAQAGSAKSQTFVGYCFDYGRGIEQNRTAAIKWYSKAARQGFPDALFNLAVLREMRVSGESKQAVDFYREAAEKGHLQAQSNLAVRLLEGRGVTQDIQAGVWWLRKAARRGDAKAQFNLGVAYLEGEGVRPSPTRAKSWLERAAAQGHAKAKRKLRMKILVSGSAQQ